MEYIVEIDNLSKDYETGFWRKRKTRALDGLTLNVRPGQIFGFLGGNGAGKTTTIKILMTLLFPSEGSARILGRDISEARMHDMIGYCPENPYFYDYLTAAELMNYFGELFGLPGQLRKEKAETLLRKVGLDEKDWNKQLRKFSKGMLQRVGLAQSLINDPQIVFLDEPMSGLDPIGRREVRELIAELRDSGTTVFMSTHILSDVEALCDEVAILRTGRLAATGKLTELLAGEGSRDFEIQLRGITAERLTNDLSAFAGIEIVGAADAATVRSVAEADVERILSTARQAGASLVSVQSVKQSLEELFVKETSES